MRWTIHLEGGPRRVNHAAVVLSGNVYSFGGYCSGDVQNGMENIDVHMLDTETYRWSKVQHTNEPESEVRSFSIDGQPLEQLPYQRYGHTVCAYRNEAYLWGGRNDEFGASNVIHKFDPVARRWSLVKTIGSIPPARDGHTAIVVDDKMIVFGGFEEDMQRFSQETYVYNFLTCRWTEFVTKGDPPTWRDFHTAVEIDDVMYVFGGRSDHNGQFHSTRDKYDTQLMALNLVTGEWTRPTVSGTAPCGRRSHSAWSYEGKMYLFGGYLGTKNVHFGDLFCYDPKTSVWTYLRPFGECPAPRRRQCTVLVGNRVFLFGGTMPNPKACTPILSSIEPQTLNTAAGLADLADLYVLDYSPSLRQLAMSKVLQLIDHDPLILRYRFNSLLPYELREDMFLMIHPNTVTTSAQLRNETSG
ncbi:unnamed protein product [Caenorhabditis auriculariae]|uniref:Kelch domain-containing protein 3 n=1 Tax=Caenorhabditis auriculariae TaxID=2777116 RepID=A0A8S1HHK4_9PELO|nr:unnamed protein product [Caenorhabditis auriculariae]